MDAQAWVGVTIAETAIAGIQAREIAEAATAAVVIDVLAKEQNGPNSERHSATR
jgi:hypothetical protein